MKKKSVSKAPTPVKVISILGYIGAAFLIIAAIAFFFGGSLGGFGILGILGSGLFILAGIILLALGIFGFFVAKGLWECKQWARIITIVFAILSVIGALGSLISGDASNIASLIINGLIGYYLMFNKEVKKAFK